MENKVDLARSLKAIKNVANNDSWFKDTPHYWATASLPLAYAVACVEVVTKNSVKAGILYQKIIEAWIDPGIKDVFYEISSLIPESEREKRKQAFIHPENEFLPDPNKPFNKIEDFFSNFEINEDFFKDDENGPISTDDLKDIEEFTRLIKLICEFIIVGFNRESDIEKVRYRVIPSEKHPWLILAVTICTSLESHNITLDMLRHYYKVRKYKDKIIDFHKVLTEQPMSRWHRR